MWVGGDYQFPSRELHNDSQTLNSAPFLCAGVTGVRVSNCGVASKEREVGEVNRILNVNLSSQYFLNKSVDKAVWQIYHDSINWLKGYTGVLISPKPNQEGNKLLFLSELREFPSVPWNVMTACVSMLLKSRTFLTCYRACFLPGRAKDLSVPRYRQPS